MSDFDVLHGARPAYSVSLAAEPREER